MRISVQCGLLLIVVILWADLIIAANKKPKKKKPHSYDSGSPEPSEIQELDAESQNFLNFLDIFDPFDEQPDIGEYLDSSIFETVDTKLADDPGFIVPSFGPENDIIVEPEYQDSRFQKPSTERKLKFWRVTIPPSSSRVVDAGTHDLQIEVYPFEGGSRVPMPDALNLVSTAWQVAKKPEWETFFRADPLVSHPKVFEFKHRNQLFSITEIQVPLVDHDTSPLLYGDLHDISRGFMRFLVKLQQYRECFFLVRKRRRRTTIASVPHGTMDVTSGPNHASAGKTALESSSESRTPDTMLKPITKAYVGFGVLARQETVQSKELGKRLFKQLGFNPDEVFDGAAEWMEKYPAKTE